MLEAVKSLSAGVGSKDAAPDDDACVAAVPMVSVTPVDGVFPPPCYVAKSYGFRGVEDQDSPWKKRGHLPEVLSPGPRVSAMTHMAACVQQAVQKNPNQNARCVSCVRREGEGGHCGGMLCVGLWVCCVSVCLCLVCVSVPVLGILAQGEETGLCRRERGGICVHVCVCVCVVCVCVVRVVVSVLCVCVLRVFCVLFGRRRRREKRLACCCDLSHGCKCLLHERYCRCILYTS